MIIEEAGRMRQEIFEENGISKHDAFEKLLLTRETVWSEPQINLTSAYVDNFSRNEEGEVAETKVSKYPESSKNEDTIWISDSSWGVVLDERRTILTLPVINAIDQLYRERMGTLPGQR